MTDQEANASVGCADAHAQPLVEQRIAMLRLVTALAFARLGLRHYPLAHALVVATIRARERIQKAGHRPEPWRPQRFARVARAGTTTTAKRRGSSLMAIRESTTIRAVQEYFCSNGRCREVQLADGPRYPVRLCVEQVPGGGRGLSRGAGGAPGLWVKYRGHREDLIALGCISRDRLAAARYDRYEDDPRGPIRYVENKAGPGRRGMIELSYFVQSRVFGGMLPGVRTYCADWLEALTGRPRLRLVIDNTRSKLN